MRKRWARLAFGFLCLCNGLYILAPASAAAVSGYPLIYQVQVGPVGSASKEFISIYNNNHQDVEITDWCLEYGLPAKTQEIGCLTPPDDKTKLWLSGNGLLLAASSDFAADYPNDVFDVPFSATIAGSDRYIRLLDQTGTEIDRLGWGNSQGEGVSVSNPTSPNVFERRANSDGSLQDINNNYADFGEVVPNYNLTSGVYEEEVAIDACPNLEGIQIDIPFGYLPDQNGDCQQDKCLNETEFPGLQLVVPDGYESLDDETCTLIPLEGAALFITELLANATSVDTGREFIELHNPNSRNINLNGYKLELGPSLTKKYIFSDKLLKAGGYISFSDTETGIVLPNTTAWLRLTAPAGNIVDQTDAYDNPKDDIAWALISNTWQYTNQPTPGGVNKTSINDEPTSSSGGSGAGLVPCPAGKFRNPATNRCKNIESTSSLKPCSVGQERNPATNRCRSVFAATTSLTPCKPGQFRNPATNRCKSSTAASSQLKPCAANQERNPATNRCRKKADVAAGKLDAIKDHQAPFIGSNNGWMIMGGTAVAVAGYGAWEWRSEVMSGWRRLRSFFGKSLPTD